jgi:hypothetical protein
MKNLVLTGMALLSSSYVLITDYGFIDHKHPVHLDGEYRQVAPAKFRTHSVHGSHEKYADARARLFYSHDITPDNTLSWGACYSYLKFDWPDNPRFRGDDYNFAGASLAWVTTSLADWRWILGTAFTVDASSFDFGKTGVYYGLMWGRCHHSDQLGLHLGWFGFAGVRNGYLLPIVGADWKWNKHWKLNAIFPVDLSLHYNFTDQWSLVLAGKTFGRPYRFPIRAHDGIGRFKNGIFQVYSSGAELDLNYTLGNKVTAEIGGGWNFGGWIFVENSQGHHGKYFKYNGAPYAQANVAVTF